MSISLNGRLFLLGGLLLPVFSADANLNRGDSSLREIPFGKVADSRMAGRSVTDPSFWSSTHPPTTGPVESGAVEARLAEPDAKEADPGDERYFGSGTWSEVSKPRMVDFSFGQPCGPISWWEPSDAVSSVSALASPVMTPPKITFEWGNMRQPANPSRNAPANPGMAIFPISLLGVLGLVLRRAH